MKWLFWTVSILLIVALLAVAAQHFRYLSTRRDIVMDRQDVFHSASVFHVATLLALSPDQPLLTGVKAFVDAVERDGATVGYAGKIAVNALQSKQLPQENWSAFVLAQYPSRDAYDAAAATPGYTETRASFANTYSLGMQRSAMLNLTLPIALLGRRIMDIVTLTPARYPFRKAGAAGQAELETPDPRSRFIEGLLANREYGKDACVVLNFIKSGSTEQREANSGYGNEMLGLMAEMGNGPTHIGRAVTLEGDADFDQVVIVYYPGVEYFADLVQSEFFTGIVGGKQLGDTLASPTVPLLPYL